MPGFLIARADAPGLFVLAGLVLIDGIWWADPASLLTGDGYLADDPDFGFSIDDSAISGLPVLTRAGEIFRGEA